MVYRSTFSSCANPAAAATAPVPAPRSRRGRKAIWLPKKISNADASQEAIFAKTYVRDGRTAARLQREYNRFCALNDLDPRTATAALAVIGQMLNAGLKASSVNTYIGHIVAGMQRPLPAGFGEILVACDKAHADSEDETQAAIAFSETELQELFRTMCPPTNNSERQRMRTFIFIMILTGWRWVDITRLRRKAFSFHHAGFIMITARWTKTIRSRAGRRTVSFPTDRLGRIPEDIQRDIESAPRQTRLFQSACPYHRVLKLIKSFASDRSTYSIRYQFVAWALAECEGDVDAVARRFTLHRDSSMLHAFYINWSQVQPTVA